VSVDRGVESPALRTADRLLDDLAARSVVPKGSLATGFSPLDMVLAGGFQPEELVILGGRPGVGKTVALLQFARAAASACRPVAIVSYEHSPQSMMRRLIAAEIASVAQGTVGPSHMAVIRRAVRDHAEGRIDRREFMGTHPCVGEAMDRLHRDGPFLSLMRGDANRTDAAAIEAMTEVELGSEGVVVVDYLQKVPIPTAIAGQGDSRVGEVASLLKDIAMKHRSVIVAASAANDAGMAERRLRMWGLRGSAALAHEADVAILMNDKFDIVSRNHSAFDTTLLDRYRSSVVFTIEKYRDGPAPVHLEFDKEFADFRFDPDGDFVGEQIIGDGLTSV
jgi:replicative DNA helicase